MKYDIDSIGRRMAQQDNRSMQYSQYFHGADDKLLEAVIERVEEIAEDASMGEL